jgi:hypothetical protein
VAGEHRHQSAATQADGLQEQQFYAVMHHLATVLWMKGLVVEGLAALSAVVEWAVTREEAPAPRRKS